MAAIQSDNKAHAAACVLSEGTRQSDMAQAVLAGNNAAVAAAVKTAEIAHYRRIIASCMANGLPWNEFNVALRSLGASGI